MENLSMAECRKRIGVSYLGGTTHSAKMRYSFNNGTMTYCVYLAPSNMAYPNTNKTVCPNDKWCKAFCLNNAGHNKADILARGVEESKINISRIKKTKAFFEQHEVFMQLLIKEIESARAKAKRMGYEFSVRLNGTSDLSPEQFRYNGKNILEIFPDVQFYDYTKCSGRFNLCKKYPNYDLTLSYNGHNWNKCEEVLNNGGKVAVVFSSHDMPKAFCGYNVENGNDSDMRYLNSPSSIIFLHYHPTALDYVVNPLTKKREFVEPDTSFVVKSTDNRIVF